MHHILSIIFVCFLTHQISISVHVENITVTRGEQVKFHCRFPLNFSARENIIQWKKSQFDDDNLIISINGKIPQIFGNAYGTNLTNRSSSLELFHVDKQDSTTYICQTFETQTILCQYNLIVLIKPEAPLLTINKENVEEYQAVTLTCTSYNGNPSPEYTWYRNGTRLTSLPEQVNTTGNRSTYTFNVTRADNRIQYECQIWNQALASPLRVEQYLHVKYRPYVKILEAGTILSSVEQRAQNLTCHFDANPPPISIYWLTNGTTIVSRESTVYMPRLTPEQSGVYTCIVENSIGKANQSVYLDVQYTPRVRAVQSRIVVNRSDPIELRCTSDSNPPPYQTIWLKNNSQIFRGNQLSGLHIDRAERNDSGLYTCHVYNRFSNNETRNGSSTIELIVQSRPIIETTHSKIAVEMDQSATLTCRVFAQPKAQIIWKHNGEILPCDDVVDDRCYLRLSKITKKDFGVYQCVAENLLGREEWTYHVVSRGKPETPTDIIVSDITASSFRMQFSPAFDGGSGSQQFVIQVISADNSSTMNQSIPMKTHEYIVRGLNESTLYMFRIKAMNMYGESPWSNDIPVQTNELLVTADDLPQLHVVSYHSKDHLLQFDYLPDTSRSMKLSEERLCLNLRQSSDGNNYRLFEPCLPIRNHRVTWEVEKDFPYLKLSVCSKKHRRICGPEMEMKEEINNRNTTAMIIGIVVMANFLVLVVIIVIGVKCCRLRKQRLQSTMNKFSINDLGKGVKPIISEPRLQNPYLLYSNSNSHMSPYDYEYQQRKVASSFSHSCDREQNRDEFEYGTAIRTATIRTSPHWKCSDSRSNSNPSSESSCGTQNTNILFNHPDPHPNSTNSVLISHYGFPPIVSPLKQHSNTLIQSSSSSESSTPSRIQKLFYEVVV